MIGSSALPNFPVDVQSGVGVRVSRQGASFRFDLDDKPLTTNGSGATFTVETEAGRAALFDGQAFIIRANRDFVGDALLGIDGQSPRPWLDVNGAKLARVVAERIYRAIYDARLGAFRCDALALVGNDTLAPMPARTLKGNPGSVAAAPSDLGAEQVRAVIGLDRVENTTDAQKAASGPIAEAINTRAPKQSPSFTGTALVEGSPVVTDARLSSRPVVSTSGQMRPLQDWLDTVGSLQSGLETGALAYDTLAQLAANLTPIAGATAQVVADGDNNGFYVKSGGSGTGSWVRKSTATVPALDGRLQAVEALTRQVRLQFGPTQPTVNGTDLLVPVFNTVEPDRNPIFRRVDPGPLEKFFRLQISQTADEWRHYVDLDLVKAGETVNAVLTASGLGAPLSTSPNKIFFATSCNGVVSPWPGYTIVSPESGGVGRNQIDFSAQIDQAPFFERAAAFENTTNPVINNLGFSRIARDRTNGRPFVTTPIKTPRQYELQFERVGVETDADFNWYTPTAYFFDAADNLVDTRTLEFERVLSPRVAVFIYNGVNLNTTATKVSIGIENSGGHGTVGIFGPQYDSRPGLRWILRDDNPAPGQVDLAPALRATKSALARTTQLVCPKIAVIGDSISQNGLFATAANGGYIGSTALSEIDYGLSLSRRGHFANWINPSRAQGFDGGNGGVSGERTDQMRARLPDLLATGPEILVVAGGTNNLVQNYELYTEEGLKADLLAMVQDAQDSGVRWVVAKTIPPLGPTTLDPNVPAQAERRRIRVRVNEWIRTVLARRPGVVLWDAAKAYEDTNRPTGVIAGDFLPKAGTLLDDTHPSPFGVATCGGPSFAAVLSRIVPLYRAYMPLDTDNLLTSAPFRGETGLKLTDRVTGKVPTGVRIGMGPGASTVEAVLQAARLDAYHPPESKVLTLAITPAGNAVVEQIFIDQITTVDVARYRGQYVSFWALVEKQAWNAWGNIGIFANDQTGATRLADRAPYNVGTDRGSPERETMLLKTPPFLVPLDGSVRQLGCALRAAFFPQGAIGIGYLNHLDWWFGPEDDPRPLNNRPLF